MKRFFTLFVLFIFCGCAKQKYRLMTVTEVVLTNGGSSFLGNDGGVWNFVAIDSVKEYRSWRHKITKIGDKICVFDSENTLFGEIMSEHELNACSQ